MKTNLTMNLAPKLTGKLKNGILLTALAASLSACIVAPPQPIGYRMTSSVLPTYVNGQYVGMQPSNYVPPATAQAPAPAPAPAVVPAPVTAAAQPVYIQSTTPSVVYVQAPPPVYTYDPYPQPYYPYPYYSPFYFNPWYGGIGIGIGLRIRGRGH